MDGFCLINESSEPAIVHDVVVAMATQLAKHHLRVAAAWERLPKPVSMADSEAAAPKDAELVLVKLVDTLPVQGALAYHTVTADGRPLILIGVGVIKANMGAAANWIFGPEGLLCTISHEIAECFINPYCEDYWPLDANTWIPKEVCDFSQGDSYEEEKGSGMFLANAATPRYFSSRKDGPFDLMGLATSAGELRTGGYQSRSSGSPSAPASNVFGAEPREGGMPQWKRDAKLLEGARCTVLARQRLAKAA